MNSIEAKRFIIILYSIQINIILIKDPLNVSYQITLEKV